MAEEETISRDGKYLVENYLKELKYLERLKRDVSNAETNLEISKKNLAKFLLPKDYNINETYCIWHPVRDEHGVDKANMIKLKVVYDPSDELDDDGARIEKYELTLHTRY